jgi:hypothetical protein
MNVVNISSRTKKEFLKLDDEEKKIFFSLMKNSPEFFKIDEIDKNLMAWFVSESPTRVKSWLEYLAADYKRKSIDIDAEKLFFEIQQAIFAN